MIDQLTNCDEIETEKQVAFLATTPVKGIAHRIRDGVYTIKKGIVTSIESLGSLETLYDNIGNRFALWK